MLLTCMASCIHWLRPANENVQGAPWHCWEYGFTIRFYKEECANEDV
jgi:hypothetical protein